MKKTVMWDVAYDETYAVEEKMWWFKSLRRVLYWSITSFGNPTTILDAGCGTGMNMQMLRNRGYTIYGIDVSSAALAYCKKRKLTGLKHGSITHIPYKNQSFNAVISTDVVGILSPPEAKKAASEFHRVLTKGGVLILQAAALESIRSPHDDVTSLRHRYTTDELAILFPRNKWIIEKLSYRIFFLFPLIALIKLVKASAKSKESHSDLKTPPLFINTILYMIQSVEDVLLKFMNFPIGSSVFLIARKR